MANVPTEIIIKLLGGGGGEGARKDVGDYHTALYRGSSPPERVSRCFQHSPVTGQHNTSSKYP